MRVFITGIFMAVVPWGYAVKIHMVAGIVGLVVQGIGLMLIIYTLIRVVRGKSL